MKTMKILEKDVIELTVGDLVVEVKEMVKGVTGRGALIDIDRIFVLVDEPGKEESDG